MRMHSRLFQIAVCLGVMAALPAAPGLAADTGNGSKNFTAPATVPNYFSNEAGPMIGGAAESQRGALYPSQAAGSAAASVAEAPQRAIRQHLALAEPHGRAIRGRSAPVVAHHVAVHGHATAYVAAHGASRGHVVHAATGKTTHPVTRVSSTHRHARG
jgi:hypothetical protein